MRIFEDLLAKLIYPKPPSPQVGPQSMLAYWLGYWKYCKKKSLHRYWIQNQVESRGSTQYQIVNLRCAGDGFICRIGRTHLANIWMNRVNEDVGRIHLVSPQTLLHLQDK